MTDLELDSCNYPVLVRAWDPGAASSEDGSTRRCGGPSVAWRINRSGHPFRLILSRCERHVKREDGLTTVSREEAVVASVLES